MEREIVGVIWLALSVAIVFAIDNAARHEREQCEKHANTQLINDVLAHDRARRQREEEKMSVKNLGKPSKDDAIGLVPKDTYDKLEEENTELRELCLSAHRWMCRALYDGSARRYEYESITECMRELGIEVDDG